MSARRVENQWLIPCSHELVDATRYLKQCERITKKKLTDLKTIRSTDTQTVTQLSLLLETHRDSQKMVMDQMDFPTISAYKQRSPYSDDVVKALDLKEQIRQFEDIVNTCSTRETREVSDVVLEKLVQMCLTGQSDAELEELTQQEDKWWKRVDNVQFKLPVDDEYQQELDSVVQHMSAEQNIKAEYAQALLKFFPPSKQNK